MVDKHYELRDGAECLMCCDIECCDTYTEMLNDMANKLSTDGVYEDEHKNLMYGIYMQELKDIVAERKAELMKKLQEEGHSNE